MDHLIPHTVPAYQYKVYPVAPVSKPRMTQRDKWAKRKPVLEYYAYKDELRMRGVQLPESGYHVIFVIEVPASWSARKKLEAYGKPHQSKPDKDNLEKGLMDALFEDDSKVWDGRVTKIWGPSGAIAIGKAVDFVV